MKRTLFVFSALITGLLTFSSCNKNLKDDIKDLRNQLDSVSHAIGADEPITVTTSFKDNNNVSRNITETYRFKSNGKNTQKLLKKLDGNYEIYIERFLDVNWNEGIDLGFIYNPTTKAITNKNVTHYWDDYANYNPYARYFEGGNYPGLSININIKKIDLTTGAISLEVDASGNEEYSNTAPGYYVPRRGAAVNTKFSFEGKLKYFEQSNQPS